MRFGVFSLAILFGISCMAGAENATPARQARMRGTISKVIAEQTSAGISVRDEKICDFDIAVPVYDRRGGSQLPEALANTPPCPATLQGAPVRVYASGSMDLNPAKDGMPELKNAGLILSSSSATGTTTGDFAGAGTEKLDAKFIVIALPGGLFGPSLPAEGAERFAIRATFED